MRVKPVGGAIALLVSVTLAGTPAAPGAAQPAIASAPDADAIVLTVESALLDATYACLVETKAVSPDTLPSAAVGGITASGVAVAPTDVSAATSDCGVQVASRVHQILAANTDDATEGAQEVKEFAEAASAGEVAFAPPSRTPAASQSQVAPLAAVTVDGWVNGMNNKQDKLMDFFITGYGDPGYFNWSSDECSAPLVGNSVWGFAWPCRRHDFGYRNLKGGETRFPNWRLWVVHNKAVTDRQFRDDLNSHCNGTSSPSACRSDAAVYHYAVSVNGMNTWGLEVHTLFKYAR